MTIKTFAAAASVAVLALAATPAAAQPMNASPWAGLYIGIGGHVGETFGGNKLSFEDLSPGHELSFQANNESTSLIGGVQLGQLWPVGGVALGLESDVSWAKNIKYLSSLRALLGLPVGHFLVYGTGGLGIEIAHEQFSVASTSGEVDNFIGDEKKYGWVAGAGIQALVAPRLSLGVEALYYGLGRDTNPLATVIGAEPFNMVADRNFTVVRARLDYHFSSFF